MLEISLDQSLKYLLRRRPINPQPDSPETYRCIREWIRLCISQHDDGRESMEGSDLLPSRLMYIKKHGQGYKFRLISPSSRCSTKLDFVSLSYCWGGDQPHKTTRSTLADRIQLVSSRELPKTIQDAVRVTYELGYEYLGSIPFALFRTMRKRKEEKLLTCQLFTETLLSLL